MKSPLAPARVLVCVFAMLAAALAHATEAVRPKLYLIGGSTMATFPPTRPVVGWGQMLPTFFKDPAQLDNRALSGRSSKSFIDQGHWEKLMTDLRAGDFLIICFGTNDSTSDPARHTDPQGSFQVNLERFIRETRAKGATPILATSVARRSWDEQGKFIDPVSEYVNATREIAARERVPLLELRRATVELEKSLGVEGSKALHLHFPPGRFESYPNGAKDDTHYNTQGATRVAELAVREMVRLDLPLCEWLRESAPSGAVER